MLILACLILFQPSSASAAEPAGEIVTEDSTAPIATEEETRMPSKIPFLITFGVHGGYDSNPNTTSNGSGSLFTDQQLTLAYDRLRGPLDLKALAAVGVVERYRRRDGCQHLAGSFTQLCCIAAAHFGREHQRSLYLRAEFRIQRWSDPARRELFCDGRRAFGCVSVVGPVLNRQQLFL